MKDKDHFLGTSGAGSDETSPTTETESTEIAEGAIAPAPAPTSEDGGGMPAFRGRLSEEQIGDVAAHGVHGIVGK